jgi:hypothetical protein
MWHAAVAGQPPQFVSAYPLEIEPLPRSVSGRSSKEPGRVSSSMRVGASRLPR